MRSLSFRRRPIFQRSTSVAFAFAALLLPAALPAAAVALECSAKSGPAKVALLELYTSEGCSSCPPADRWVSGLNRQGFAATQVIPLSFHVDYWNYIGWNDRFSDKKYSERQRDVSSHNNSSVIYTPQLVLNGKDLRGQQHGDFAGMLRTANANTPDATINLLLNRADPARFAVSGDVVLTNPAQQKNAQTFVALVENNLMTEVKAGENRGETLRHDYVVRELAGPFAADASGFVKIDKAFDLKRDWKAADSMLVAFVQNPKTGDVLQALALPACK